MDRNYLVVFILHKLGKARFIGDQYSLPSSWLCKLIELARTKECTLIGLNELLVNSRIEDWPQVSISFDDGYASDIEIALPSLLETSSRATFFIVPAFIGQPDFLSWSQVRSLAEAGMTIGSHSLNHVWLSELPVKELNRELSLSRRRIEDAIGEPVRVLSLPGGYSNRKVMESAWEVGYHVVCDSEYGINWVHNLDTNKPIRLRRNCLDLRVNWKSVSILLEGRVSLETHLLNWPRNWLVKWIKPSLYEEVASIWRGK